VGFDPTRRQASMDFDLDRDFGGEEYDPKAAEEYVDELNDLFLSSPEAEACGVDELGYAHLLLTYALDYLQVTPATMTRANLEEVLFRIFPRKVSVEASEAENIVHEVRAFLEYVAREFRSEQARECLAVLDDRAADRLGEELAEPGNFGLAKSFFSQGAAAGFDLSNEAGLQEWVRTYNRDPDRYDVSLPLLPNPGVPSLPAPNRPDTANVRRQEKNAKKRKRRQARQSRRRNR
jgi:hypothetical protein